MFISHFKRKSSSPKCIHTAKGNFKTDEWREGEGKERGRENMLKEGEGGRKVAVTEKEDKEMVKEIQRA